MLKKIILASKMKSMREKSFTKIQTLRGDWGRGGGTGENLVQTTGLREEQMKVMRGLLAFLRAP